MGTMTLSSVKMFIWALPPPSSLLPPLLLPVLSATYVFSPSSDSLIIKRSSLYGQKLVEKRIEKFTPETVGIGLEVANLGENEKQKT
jgi:hypothetical protein